MNRVCISARKYKAGYEVRTELVDGKEYGSPDITMKSAYTPTGDYIGRSKFAHYLTVKRGIVPEKASPSHNVTSIGFCKAENKWYGWSHRAIAGFGIGDKLFIAPFGDESTPFKQHGVETIRTLSQAKQAAINFAASAS